MRIPEATIEEIRNSADIVDFISGYVQLRKRGKNFIGLCPFHQEKTPSFTVSQEKQIFHCFGCHAGGNIFKFLMEYKSISFVEAVQEVAEFIGISITPDESSYTIENSELEELYDINVTAAKYFLNNLINKDVTNEASRYLEERNIKLQTQKIFGLGYALPGWDNFVKYANEQKLDLEKVRMLGLIDSKSNGQYYDKFRNRIIFPIFSPNGRVIAFGGRIFQGEDNVAKYLNSPESTIYLKRKSLYGLFHSKDEIRNKNKAILVEGYMDVIALYQHGIKNVIASSGTSLTEEQVRLLSRYTKNIVVIFDADIAGRKAALRSIEILLKQDFEVLVLSLPDGEDPDSYVNKYGEKQFEEILGKAKNFLEFQTDEYKKNGMFENPSTEAEAIRELVKSASFVNDELKRSLLLKSIARKFNLREKLLETELNKFLERNKKSSSRKHVKQQAGKKTVASKGNNNGSDEKYKKIEIDFIQLLFEGKEEIMGLIFDTILPEDFQNKTLSSLAQIAYETYRSGNISVSSMIEKIENEEVKNYILSLSLNDYQISSNWNEHSTTGKIEKDLTKQTKDLIKKYQIMKIDEQIAENNFKIENLGNDPEVIELMKINNELIKEKSVIING